MSKFLKQIHIPQTSRVLKFSSNTETFYFSTNQHTISYLLAIETFALVYKVKEGCIDIYAKMHLDINLESSAPPIKINDCATITIRHTGEELSLELL